MTENIMEEKKYLYKFIKIYSNKDKDNFFIFTTRCKNVYLAISNIKKKLQNSNSRLSDIVEDCSYLQIKTCMCSSLTALFERDFLQDKYDDIIETKINNYII